MSGCGCCATGERQGDAAVACRAVEVTLVVEIAASPAKVWGAMTTGLGKWWLKDFHCAPGSKGIAMELKVGGRVWETDGKGGGLLWYTIGAIEKGRSITMSGHIGPPFGGPATTILNWSIEKSGKGTRFTLTDNLFGAVDGAMAAQIDSGWRQLIGVGLKGYLEKARKGR